MMPSCPPVPLTEPRPALYNPRWLLATVLSFLLIALWDVSGQDLALAQVWGTAQGFALRDDHFLVTYMHQGMRNLGWVIVLALSLGVWMPFGLLRKLPTARRVQLLVSILASLAVVAILKRSSATSCPWDLSLFGGVAEYVSHWRWGVHDGGAGRCFPAGGGLFLCRRLFCAGPRYTARRPLVAGRGARDGPAAGPGPADARRPLYEPHLVDRLAVLDRRPGHRHGHGTPPSQRLSA